MGGVAFLCLLVYLSCFDSNSLTFGMGKGNCFWGVGCFGGVGVFVVVAALIFFYRGCYCFVLCCFHRELVLKFITDIEFESVPYIKQRLVLD